MDCCDTCGAKRPSWLGAAHNCPGDYVRHRSMDGRPAGAPEPHTVEEYELGYLATGNVWHNYLTQP